MFRKIVNQDKLRDHFYFELSGTFPIVKNNCLQHVNVFNKKYLLDNYKLSQIW